MAKKIFSFLAVFLFGVCMTACGGEKEPENTWKGIGPGADLAAITERTEYYDLVVESETLFNFGLWEKNPEEYTLTFLYNGGILYNPLGIQYAMGEPVQIWAEISSNGADIYLYDTDGGRELLLERISSNYASADSKFRCYVDGERNCYFYRTDYSKTNGEYTNVGILVKMLPSGDKVYENKLEPGFMISDICQMEDGRIYLLLYNNDTREQVIEELDPETGQPVTESRMKLSFGTVNLGCDNGFLAVAGYGIDNGGCGIAAVDMAAQSTSALLYFYGTSYGWHDDSILQDFRVLEDGAVDFLWTDRKGLNCFRERLRMEKVEKNPIVLRGIFFADTWLSEQVALFNRESKDYHVVMESCGFGNDLEDFARLTSVQIGAGKGPDILCGDYLLHDYIGGLLEKGALEKLNPYMETSGIREEDFFPLTFSAWRQGENIYGVTPKMEVSSEEMDIEVLGSREIPDIEALADALLAREENGVYRRRLDSGQLLNSFLQGSETLWGMVDWEAGSCDFNTPLFEKLLEAARRYGDNGQKDLSPEIAYNVNLKFFFGFNGSAEQEVEGRVCSGFLFDDGCHGLSTPLYTMTVNANSKHKEGAWEFISFLLGEEVQGSQKWDVPPVHRKAFDQWLEQCISTLSEERFENGHMYYPAYYGEDTSAEKREEYKRAIEDVRNLPLQNALILTIVLDEAEYYFNGSKSAEEVSLMINNRVQLYLDE